MAAPGYGGDGHCAGKESWEQSGLPQGASPFMFHDLPYSPGASYQMSLAMRVSSQTMIGANAFCWIGWWGQAGVEDAGYLTTSSSNWQFMQSDVFEPPVHQPSPVLRFGIGMLVNVSAVEAMAYFDNIEVVAYGLTTPAPVRLNLRAWLEGPFVQAQSLMNDDLRVAGLLPGWDPYGSGASVPASVLSVIGNNAVVDWVQVELRLHPEGPTGVASAPGLIQRDGDIVATDGTSALPFNVPPGNYYVAVRHRNHLAIMGSTAYVLTTTPVSLDFRVPATSMHVRPAPYAGVPRKNVGPWSVMWAGNVTDDDRLRYTGTSNDRDPVLMAIGGSTPNAVVAGYMNADVNLDGLVKYTGAGNDRDPILVNVGSTTPNAVRIEQVP